MVQLAWVIFEKNSLSVTSLQAPVQVRKKISKKTIFSCLKKVAKANTVLLQMQIAYLHGWEAMRWAVLHWPCSSRKILQETCCLFHWKWKSWHFELRGMKLYPCSSRYSVSDRFMYCNCRPSCMLDFSWQVNGSSLDADHFPLLILHVNHFDNCKENED